MKPISQESHDSEYLIPSKSAPILSHACTRCGHSKAWGSTIRSSDSLFHMLFYKPYRCRACMSRFWKLHSTFRLNVFIASIVLLVAVLGICTKSLFATKPTEQTLSLVENDKAKRRAQEGDSDAALQVGMNYINNGSITKRKEAAKWLEQSAKKNNTDAQYYYGLSLLGGQGVIQDYKAGFFWIDKAARRGHPEAQYSLGKMYRKGTGVEIDRGRAYLWFNLAAAQGIQDAARNRDSIANHLSLEEVLAMQEEAYRIGGIADDATKFSDSTLETSQDLSLK